MNKIKISLFELLRCVSHAQDLVSPLLSNHQQQVAYLSYCLAKKMELPMEQQKDIFLAAIVHDIGTLSVNERLETIENEPLYINNHAFIGAKLLGEFKPLQNAAGIIKFHHLPWDNGNGKNYEGEVVSIGSHVIHLADRVCMMIQSGRNVLSQRSRILETINQQSNVTFEPGLVHVFSELMDQEYIWLDLISNSPIDKINTKLFDNHELEIDDLIDLTYIFSQIIDFRSSFTARHSAGVGKMAERLANLVGFSTLECKMMLVAGYLHDLGKHAINTSVLEKPSRLNEDEFNEIRMHTYYTYQLLDKIPQLELIKTWASYHHERIDGNGYPFHIKGENLSIGSRIMAVADVFTAIKEERPYRKEMDDKHAINTLNSMVCSGALDGRLVRILIENFRSMNEVRENAQKQASKRYRNFLTH